MPSSSIVVGFQAAGTGTAVELALDRGPAASPECPWQAEDRTPITPSLTHAVHRADANAIPLQRRSCSVGTRRRLRVLLGSVDEYRADDPLSPVRARDVGS